MEKSDLQLINDFQAGEEAAFEQLTDRYANKVFSLASRFTRNQEDAEEVLQDVFITVFQKVSGFEGKSSFSSWLYRVTVNAALMKVRKRKQDRSVSVEDLDPQSRQSLQMSHNERLQCDAAAYRRELVQALELAIHGLPVDYRSVYVLRDIDGLTSREVSKMLDLSLAAVKSRLHRSRLALRRKLIELYREYREQAQLRKAAGA